MSAQTTSAFSDVLKEYRLAAGLTQEALAERAGVSARNIQNLERGENKPLKDTARRLAEALELGERERALLLTAVIPVPRRRVAVVAALPTPELPLPVEAALGDGTPAALPPAVAAPPVAPPASPRHNLPVALSSFIGRARERTRVGELLAAHRLVTLVGAGGVGKTRLALAVAERLLATYPEGIWLVELAPLADPALVPGAVAAALGLREEVGRPLLETLSTHLKDKHLLLILDNCEHLVAACAALAGVLLRACPEVRILATSREGLAIAGERHWRVPSLSVPDPKHLPEPELAGSYEAVRLFVERAAERRDDFALTEGNARVIAEVCAHLDGVPLAIELAAARAGSLSVEAIAARLDERFRLLTGGARDLPARQRTLRAALDWSWDLLAEGERALLAQLAVFVGGWVLAAAEAVCAGDELGAWVVLDGLDTLVGKSLVQVDESGEGAGRYRLLETVRQYAAERLGEQGEAAAVRDRHLTWCLDLAEQADPRLRGPEQGAWLARLETEHDNLRAALGWARERGAGVEGMRLAGALGYFWNMHGHLSEGRGWLEGALGAGEGGSPVVRARALHGAGILAYRQGEYARATALHEESLALYRELGNTSGIASSLASLELVAFQQGEFGRAVALDEEALVLYRALGNTWGTAAVLNNLGGVVYWQGDYARATALHEEALALRRALGDQQTIAHSLNNLGMVAERRGEYGWATTLHEEALALRRAVGDQQGIAGSLNELGKVAEARGEYARAMALQEESLALKRELGDTWGIANSLGDLGLVAGSMGDYARATALQEEALALRRAVGDKLGTAMSLRNLGLVAYRRGDYPRAVRLQQEGLALGREIGARDQVAGGLEALAATVLALGVPLQAARLGGAAETLREALGQPLTPAERGDHDRALRAMRTALGEAAFEAAWAEGRALPPEEAVAPALAEPAHLDR